MGFQTVLFGVLGAVCLAASGTLPSHGQEKKSDIESVKLYSDEEIRKLSKQDIEKESSSKNGLLGLPCLDIVAPGKRDSRGNVFKALKLEDKRITDFRQSGLMSVAFLTWQVSPSYDISCMTGTNDRDNEGLEWTDPRRMVYGIRLVKREK